MTWCDFLGALSPVDRVLDMNGGGGAKMRSTFDLNNSAQTAPVKYFGLCFDVSHKDLLLKACDEHIMLNVQKNEFTLDGDMKESVEKYFAHIKDRAEAVDESDDEDQKHED